MKTRIVTLCVFAFLVVSLSDLRAQSNQPSQPIDPTAQAPATPAARIRMTMRYVQVTQQDLQREFHRACQNTTQRHRFPKLPLPLTTAPPRADLFTIRNSIVAASHLLHMFRLELRDCKASHKLRRLAQRLLKITQ
jgi:hypothetical protein